MALSGTPCAQLRAAAAAAAAAEAPKRISQQNLVFGGMEWMPRGSTKHPQRASPALTAVPQEAGRLAACTDSSATGSLAGGLPGWLAAWPKTVVALTSEDKHCLMPRISIDSAKAHDTAAHRGGQNRPHAQTQLNTQVQAPRRVLAPAAAKRLPWPNTRGAAGCCQPPIILHLPQQLISHTTTHP